MLLNLDDYERAAREKLPESFLAYFAGGSADEVTLRENRSCFDDHRLRPRVMVDVTERHTALELLGAEMSMPVLIAPTAMARLAHADAEGGIARAARDAGIVQCVSTLSTTPLERVVGEGNVAWFQVYVYRDRALTESLVDRAVAAGYRALVLTVDVPVIGLREGIRRTGLTLPADVSFANFDGVHDTFGEDVNAYIESQFDPSLTWRDVEWLAERAGIPVLVKGILRGDDGRRAVDHGAAGVIVSNHGGRQLDSATTGIAALPEVVREVGGEVPVLVDGGVRRGTDVVKALALGASAVLVGRPVVWGLAVDGERGVASVLEILREELDVAMALCGCPSVGAIGPDLLAPRGGTSARD